LLLIPTTLDATPTAHEAVSIFMSLSDSPKCR